MEKKLLKLITKNVSKVETVDSTVGFGYKIQTESGHIFIHQKDLNEMLVLVYLDQDGSGKLSWTFNFKNSLVIKELITERFIKNDSNKLDDFLNIEKKVKQERLNSEFINLLEENIKNLSNGNGCFYQTNRKDYKKELSTNSGFGSNDLVESRINAYHYLTVKYGRKLEFSIDEMFVVKWTLK